MENSNKETTEFAVLPAKLINSVYKSLEDGKFTAGSDLVHFFDDLVAIQPAISGIEKVDDEGATMTNEQKDEVKEAILKELTSPSETDAYDLAEGMGGILAIARLFWRRGYNAAVENAEAGNNIVKV